MWKGIFKKKKSDRIIVEKNSFIIGANETMVQHLGLRIIHNEFRPLIESGNVVPCEKKYMFSTYEDNQEQIILTLYRGNSINIDECSYLGQYQIIKIPKARARDPQIEVTFGVSRTDIWIEARDSNTSNPYNIIKIEEERNMGKGLN